jgi:hypothetical protein
MHHCIAGYDEDCKDGVSTIFSLRKTIDNEMSTPLATIEVGLSEMTIIEAKAKFNQEPDNKSLELIDLWAKNSEINKVEQVAYDVHHQNQGDRIVHNVQYAEDENYNIIIIVKVIFWILYLMAKAGFFS